MSVICNSSIDVSQFRLMSVYVGQCQFGQFGRFCLILVEVGQILSMFADVGVDIN